MNCFRRFVYSFLCILFCFIITGHFVRADDLQDTERALKLISDFTDRMCKEAPLSGSSETVELAANGQAELSKLVKMITDIGFEGAAKYQTSKWEGPLQKNIAQLIIDQHKCNVEISKLLINKLIPKRESKALDVISLYKSLPKEERELLLKQIDNDQQLIDLLNRELSKTKADLEETKADLDEAKAEIKDWVKSYSELKIMYSQLSKNSEKSIKAKEALIDGDLKKAEGILVIQNVNIVGVGVNN